MKALEKRMAMVVSANTFEFHQIVGEQIGYTIDKGFVTEKTSRINLSAIVPILATLEGKDNYYEALYEYQALHEGANKVVVTPDCRKTMKVSFANLEKLLCNNFSFHFLKIAWIECDKIWANYIHKDSATTAIGSMAFRSISDEIEKNGDYPLRDLAWQEYQLIKEIAKNNNLKGEERIWV